MRAEVGNLPVWGTKTPVLARRLGPPAKPAGASHVAIEYLGFVCTSFKNSLSQCLGHEKDLPVCPGASLEACALAACAG